MFWGIALVFQHNRICLGNQNKNIMFTNFCNTGFLNDYACLILNMLSLVDILQLTDGSWSANSYLLSTDKNKNIWL